MQTHPFIVPELGVVIWLHLKLKGITNVQPMFRKVFPNWCNVVPHPCDVSVGHIIMWLVIKGMYTFYNPSPQWSFLRHHHLTIKLMFSVRIEPTLRPPADFEATTLSQETQWIILFSSSPPHKNRLLIFSNVSVTVTCYYQMGNK